MAKTPTTKVVTKKHLARLERERIQQRYLIYGIVAVAVIVVGVLLYGILDQTVLQRARPVASVGSDVISTGDFQTQVRFTRYRLIQQLANYASDQMMLQFLGSYLVQIANQLNSPNELGQQVLDRMVEDQIIAQEAAKLGITVSEEELNAGVESYFGFFENGTPTPTVTPTSFSTATLSATQLALVPPTATPTETLPPTETALPTEAAATATPAASATPTTAFTATPDVTATPEPTATEYTRQGYEDLSNEYLTNLKEINFTREELRELIKALLLRDKMVAEVTKDVAPEAEMVWARHILVATEEEAKAVRDRLMAGEDFAKVAAEVSTDTSNKDLGGDLKWFTREKMVTEFSDAAFAMQIGEISQPVQTSFGYHIIQVLGHEVRPLTADEMQEARDSAFSKWIEDKRTEKNVKTFDRWIGSVPTDPEIPLELQQIIQQLNTGQ